MCAVCDTVDSDQAGGMDVGFAAEVGSRAVVFTEGAIIERLRREFAVAFDPFIQHAGFIYEPEKKMLLERLYAEYILLAQKRDAPILIMTPTRRANPERIERAGLGDRDVNGDCVRFLQDIRARHSTTSSVIQIGGLMGCRGDAYKAQDALQMSEAHAFHGPQAALLAEAGADFLFGATLPAVSEAMGLAMAMADTGVPYILSFVIRPNGALLDGTLLHDAIARIDAAVSPPPFAYMVNCVHPSILVRALNAAENRTPLVRERLMGIQGNASARSPEELDGATELAADDREAWIEGMERLRRDHLLRVFGGCCGTDDRYMAGLVEALSPATLQSRDVDKR